MPGPKAVCALTPHPPHSKTLARRSQHPLFVGSGPEPPPSLVAQISNLLYRLQGTTNLVDWADLGAYTNQSGTLVLTFPMPPGRDAYFYRTASRPPTTPPAVPAPRLSDPALLPDGNTAFKLHSIAASAWRIEGSPDLVHWGNYGIVTNTIGTLVITNTPVGTPDTYFHRVAQP